MRLVHIVDGALEVRWTWLPYWLAINPNVTSKLEARMRDILLVNGMTTRDEDLDALHSHVIRYITASYPTFEGIDEYLTAIESVQEPEK